MAAWLRHHAETIAILCVGASLGLTLHGWFSHDPSARLLALIMTSLSLAFWWVQIYLDQEEEKDMPDPMD